MRSLAVMALFAMTAGAQTTGGVLGPAEIAHLEAALAENPNDRTAQIALGRNYAFAILGITELGQHDMVAGMDLTKAASAQAQHAREAIRTSNDAGVLAESGKALWNFGTQAHSYSVLHRVNPGATYYDEQALAVQTLDRAISLDPSTPEWRSYRIPITVSRTNFDFVLPLAAAEAFPIVKDDVAHLGGISRSYAIAGVAKLAVRAGALDDAASYAGELLGVDTDWNHGNAIYFGNMVLGQVALRRGDVAGAAERLLAAGKTPGSPQLNSFGPNMTLVRELLTGDLTTPRPTRRRRAPDQFTAGGETRDAVLKFFDLCKVFWTMGGERLQIWADQVRAGVVPDFGASLLY